MRRRFYLFLLKNYGLRYICIYFWNKITKQKIKEFNPYLTLFKNKKGIEIGGPSSIFRQSGILPIYPVINNLDGCNFATKTIWEGNIKDGQTFKFDEHRSGYQYISDATDLSCIESKTYDFLISSNCLEHIANPIKALKEWLRILKDDGLFLLVVPNKKFNFDHNRQDTTFDHVLSDFKNLTAEDDLTHLEEILKYHDSTLDVFQGSSEEFRQRSLKNIENRTLHHHVFNLDLLKRLFDFLSIKIIWTYTESNFIILGEKKR